MTKKITVLLIFFIAISFLFCSNNKNKETISSEDNIEKSEVDAKETDTEVIAKEEENDEANTLTTDDIINMIKDDTEESEVKDSTNEGNKAVVKKGSIVSVHYIGKLETGEKFDSSYDRKKPLSFQVGNGDMIRGFENGVIGMTVGDKKTLTLKPEDAYGYPDERNIVTVSLAEFGDISGEYKVGDYIPVRTDDGVFEVKIVSMDNMNITLDGNHRLAGKTLIFEVEVVSIK